MKARRDKVCVSSSLDLCLVAMSCRCMNHIKELCFEHRWH
jgi:hypothetical protein